MIVSNYGIMPFTTWERRHKKLTIDRDTELDCVIDQLDCDFRESRVIANGDLDEREGARSSNYRPTTLGQLKKNKEIVNESVVQMKSKIDVDIYL